MNINQIEETVSILKRCDNEYYNDAEPSLSDAEYDALKDKLRAVDPNNPYLKNIGVAAPRVSKWNKMKHAVEMTSLNKVNSLDEFKKWAYEIGDDLYTIQEKLDGMSIDCVYENGVLVHAITRGDGVEGEDIVENVRLMKNVKTFIDGFTGSLKGEIEIFNEDFEALNKIAKKPFKNPRNASVGIAKNFDHTYCEYLTVLFYNVERKTFNLEDQFYAENEKIAFIKDLGLRTSFNKTCHLDEVIETFNEYDKIKRSEISYDIDGMVIKANNIQLQRKHGFIGGNPKAQIAWKFPPMKKDTKLLDIEWRIGRSGKISPIAILEPVKMGGVTVARASLYNVSNVLKFGFRKGDIVKVSRANDVIPVVEEVVGSNAGTLLKPPSKCPECGKDAVIDGKFLICKNDECSGAMIGTVLKWTVKSGMQTLGVGKKTIEKLYTAELVQTPADLYRLSVKDVMSLDRQGVRSSQKLIDIIQSKKEISLADFVGGLNMSGFSTESAQKLIDNGFDTIEILLAMAEDKRCIAKFSSIQGLGEKTAQFFVDGMNKRKDLIEDLLTVVTIKKEGSGDKMVAVTNTGRLNGQSFCFTGAIERCDESGNRYTRDRMHEFVINNGGQVLTSVKNGLNYLVLADPTSNSSKTQKAKKLGVTLISEKQFFIMLGM